MTRSISIIASFDQYQQLADGELLSFPGSIFYNPEFIKISAEILDLEPRPIVLMENDNVTGLANYLLRTRFGLKTMTIPKFYQYYGPILFNPDIDLINVAEKYLMQSIDLAVFSLIPEYSDVEQFDRWNKIDRLTYYLKPDTFENTRINCSEDVKNKLNKAAKSGIEIRHLSEFPYHIYAATFKRRGLNPPMSETQIVSWTSKLAQAGLIKTYGACQADSLLAFRTQLIANNYACDWLAGALPEANSLGVNQYLILVIGQELFNQKIISWDLLGGDIKSIGDFKRSFGSIPKHHLQIERAFSLKGKLYRSMMKLKVSSDA